MYACRDNIDDPPSTVTTDPVTDRDSSLAKYTAAQAAAHGVPVYLHSNV